MNSSASNWVQPVFWFSFLGCCLLALFDLAMVLISASRGNTLHLDTMGIVVSIIRYALVFSSPFVRGKIGIGMLVVYFILLSFFLARYVGD